MSDETPADAEPQSERRSHRRVPIEGARGSFLLSTDARVVNLSLDGMSLEAEAPLKVGWHYTLTLSIEDRELALAGSVVWCNLVATRRGPDGDVAPVYRAGVHFDDVLRERAAELRRFIESNAVISLEKRLFGRFRVDREHSARVDCEAEFQVEQLSLAGMQFLTELGPRIDAEYDLQVRLREGSFSTRSRIVRVEPAVRGGDEVSSTLYRVGVEFLELSDETRATLAGLVEDPSA